MVTHINRVIVWTHTFFVFWKAHVDDDVDDDARQPVWNLRFDTHTVVHSGRWSAAYPIKPN